MVSHTVYKECKICTIKWLMQRLNIGGLLIPQCKRDTVLEIYHLTD